MATTTLPATAGATLEIGISMPISSEVRTVEGEVLSHDVRYFVSSLDPDLVTAADLLRYVRDHWRVENGLHFLKDRWWDEDRHHTRRSGLSLPA